MRQWKLEIEFDDLETQKERDPELEFPQDECSTFIKNLVGEWGLLPEDLNDTTLIEFDQTHVTMYPEVLDQIVDPMCDLLMRTIPKSVTLSRD
jgi:hypothetical protein